MTEDKGNLSISWKSVAITSTILAVTAVTSTAIVATIKEADALSTVALGLAVIAFAIQIIVYIVQAETASKQDLKSQEVYGSTLKALAAIEEKAEGTRATVSLINDKMLDFALGKTIPQAESAGVAMDSPEFSALLARSINEYAKNSSFTHQAETSSAQATQTASPPIFTRKSRDPLDKSMTKFPEIDKANPIVAEMKSLSPAVLHSIYQMANDQHRTGNRMDAGGPGMFALYGDEELYNTGIIKRVRAPWANDPVFILTEKGKNAGRILLSEEDVPAELKEAVQEIRHRTNEYKKRHEERLRRGSKVPIESGE